MCRKESSHLLFDNSLQPPGEHVCEGLPRPVSDHCLQQHQPNEVDGATTIKPATWGLRKNLPWFFIACFAPFAGGEATILVEVVSD